MDDESPSGEEQEPSFPARVNVTIEKAGKPGALQIETIAQDGEIMIENVYYFTDAELADAKTADLDWSRRNLYTGPPFGNLDEDLQLLLEKYLDERGVNTALALWVPEYIDFKEQREYLSWLSSESNTLPRITSGINNPLRYEVFRRCIKEVLDSFLCTKIHISTPSVSMWWDLQLYFIELPNFSNTLAP